MEAQAAGCELALDLTMEGVSLLVRRAGAPWEQRVSVVLSEADAEARMQDLRQVAVAEAGPDATVRLWLPEDQVLVRSLALRGTDRADRRASALSALLAMTPYRAPDLVFDMAEDEATGRTTVVAVTRLTLDEATGFARAHGFSVSRVSTRAVAPGFADGPALGIEPEPARAAPPARRFALAAAALMVAGAGVAGLWLPFGTSGGPEAEAPGVTRALMAALDPAAMENASPFPGPGQAEPLRTPPPRPAAAARSIQPEPEPEISVSVLSGPGLPGPESVAPPDATQAAWQPAARMPLPTVRASRTDLPLGVESTATEGASYRRDAWPDMEGPETLELANVESTGQPPPRPGPAVVPPGPGDTALDRVRPRPRPGSLSESTAPLPPRIAPPVLPAPTPEAQPPAASVTAPAAEPPAAAVQAPVAQPPAAAEATPAQPTEAVQAPLAAPPAAAQATPAQPPAAASVQAPAAQPPATAAESVPAEDAGPPTRFAPLTATPPAAALRKLPAESPTADPPALAEETDLAASAIAPVTARLPQPRPASAADLGPQDVSPTARAVKTARRAPERPDGLDIRAASLRKSRDKADAPQTLREALARPAPTPEPAPEPEEKTDSLAMAIPSPKTVQPPRPTPAPVAKPAPAPVAKPVPAPVAKPVPAPVAKPAPSAKPDKPRTAAVPDTEVPEDVKPVTVPSATSVRRAATTPDVMDLTVMNLIGVYGSPKSRRALVRLPSGSYVRVTRGDRVEGWSVAAISEDTLRLAKGSESRTLRLMRD